MLVSKLFAAWKFNTIGFYASFMYNPSIKIKLEAIDLPIPEKLEERLEKLADKTGRTKSKRQTIRTCE